MLGSLLCLTASCSVGVDTAGADMTVAEQGVTEFRQRMATDQYGAIYAQAAPEFRQSGSEPTMLRFLENVSTRLGRVRQSTKQGSHVNISPGRTAVTIGYATEFERGRGMERFVFFVVGQEARLAGYHINSLDLMADLAGNTTSAGDEAQPVDATR